MVQTGISIEIRGPAVRMAQWRRAVKSLRTPHNMHAGQHVAVIVYSYYFVDDGQCSSLELHHCTDGE